MQVFLRVPWQRCAEGLPIHQAPTDIESVCRALGITYDGPLLDHLDLMAATALPILRKPKEPRS